MIRRPGKRKTICSVGNHFIKIVHGAEICNNMGDTMYSKLNFDHSSEGPSIRKRFVIGKITCILHLIIIHSWMSLQKRGFMRTYVISLTEILLILLITIFLTILFFFLFYKLCHK